jgi:hypothetical protein
VNLLIDESLVLPPSEIHCFRDVTLYSSVFRDLQILVESYQKDLVWRLMKHYGAFDFVEDIVEPASEDGLVLGLSRGRCNICVSSINYENLDFIISRLNGRL